MVTPGGREMIILHIHSSRSLLYGCVVRLGWSRLEPRSEGSILEMWLNVLKDELGGDQRQTYRMSVRIHLSSFGEVVSKCDQIANIRWIIEKAGEIQKNVFFCFIDYAKAFDCVAHNIVENSSRDGNTRPPYLLPVKPVCRSRSNS